MLDSNELVYIVLYCELIDTMAAFLLILISLFYTIGLSGKLFSCLTDYFYPLPGYMAFLSENAIVYIMINYKQGVLILWKNLL